MKKKNERIRPLLLCFLAAACTTGSAQVSKEALSLKEALQPAFLIGAAVTTRQMNLQDTAAVRLLRTHFNAIVPENCMKIQSLQPHEGVFHFSDADRLVAFGQQEGMHVTGHTLIWHSQVPDWFFTDKDGNEVSKEILIERMRTHITTVVSRYKGRIKGWDVVNEAVEDDGSLRRNKFLQIIGEEYIRLAFEFAHAADPDAELYYNDYSLALPRKRDGVVALAKQLLESGIPLSAIGMQGHLGMQFPSIREFEKSILAFSALGVKVMITELDLSILPEPSQRTGADIARKEAYRKEINPYTNGVPEAVYKEWQDRYLDFFTLFLKQADKISRVTLWGLSDGTSWRNNFPVRGRTDYPLLFDRQYRAKPLVYKLIERAQSDLPR